jgi:hypothetical protein
VSDIVAVAPYFFYSLQHGLSLDERIAMLFRRDSAMPAIAAAMPAMNRDLAVYEINLHTVNGDASAAERKPVVAGLPAGSALARNLLDNLALGVRRQLVYSLTGFDSQLTSGQGTVPLWGIARDVGPTNRLRPTGLALELLNEAVAGDMMAVTSRGAPDVSVYAFRSARGWAVVLVSSSPTEKNVIVHLPCQSAPCEIKDSEVRIDRLVSRSPDSTNEDAEEVRIVRETAPLLAGSISVKLSPWGLAVLLPVQE